MELDEAMTALMTPAGREDPYPAYRALREAGPLVGVTEAFFVATGYDVVDEVLRDPRQRVQDADLLDRTNPGWRDSAAAASIGRSMLATNPPDHTRMRRLAAGAFTARRVAALEESVARYADTLAGWLAVAGRDGSPVDFMTEFAYALPVRVICELLGVPSGDYAWFRERAAALTTVLEPQLSRGQLDEADRATLEVEEYFEALITDRRRAPRDDLTTALVQAAEEGTRLSTEELPANLILLLVAGFETTANLFGNGLATLFDRPALAAALRENPALAPAYTEEILRFDSPVQLTSRYSERDTRYGGVDVPAGAGILLLLGAGNRDPARFADPDRYDPHRYRPGGGPPPLSFGAGAHYCLGAALARLEGRVALPLLLSRLPGLAPAGPAVRRDRLTLRGYASLPVTPGSPSLAVAPGR
jgi:cytochrome P450